MKKIYIAPTTEQVKVRAEQQLLAGSYGLKNADATSTGGYYDTDARSSGWFEDDGEDY